MEKTGILLINLGTPSAPNRVEVFRYLREFLMDPMVVDIPFLARFILVNFVIAPFRSKSSSLKYKEIWKNKSPLLLHSESLRSQMGCLTRSCVKLAMRYGKPSIQEAIDTFVKEGVCRVIVLPMYPHRALSSSETAIIAVSKQMAKGMKYNVVKCFYDNPDYMALVSNHVKKYISDCEHLLVTFHSIPERHIIKEFPECSSCLGKNPCADLNRSCYRRQCFFTAKMLAVGLGMENKYSVGFQSRLGRTPWIKPYTDHVVVKLAKDGIKKVAVFSPSFLVDCLETLEEINIIYRKKFLESGGKKFVYIPCLNESSDLPKTIFRICQDSSNWLSD